MYNKIMIGSILFSKMQQYIIKDTIICMDHYIYDIISYKNILFHHIIRCNMTFVK